MNTLENSCFRYDGSDDSKNIIRIMNKNHRSNFKGNDKYFYWIANNIAYTFYKMDKDLTEIPPYDYLALLTGKQLTEGERKDELEKLLVVGAKIKVGKKYAEENSCVEGEIFELVEGHFEYDNGLYTEDQTAPSIWEEISKEFNSIYHLFGNNLENFMDCEVLHSSQPEIETVRRNVPCRNCNELLIECACKRNKCIECGKPVGNISFTVCDSCWDILETKRINKIVPVQEEVKRDIRKYVIELEEQTAHLQNQLKIKDNIIGNKNKSISAKADFCNQQSKIISDLQQQLKEAKELLKESFSVIQAVSTLLRVAPNNNTLPEPPHDVIKLVKSINQFLTRNK